MWKRAQGAFIAGSGMVLIKLAYFMPELWQAGMLSFIGGIVLYSGMVMLFGDDDGGGV